MSSNCQVGNFFSLLASNELMFSSCVGLQILTKWTFLLASVIMASLHATSLYPCLEHIVLRANEKERYRNKGFIIRTAVAFVTYENDNIGLPQDETFYGERLNNPTMGASRRAPSIISIEADEPLCWKKRSLSSYPKHRLVYNYIGHRRHSKFAKGLSRILGSRHLAEKLGVYFTSLTYSSWYWLDDKDINCDFQLVLQVEICDLESSEYVKRGIERAWVIERTAARRMAKEQEEQLRGPMKHYKGVRWRPERKNPWFAEIKLPNMKNKKWIGDFSTPEEAARAYDTAAIHHNKTTALNFPESMYPESKEAENPRSKSSVPDLPEEFLHLLGIIAAEDASHHASNGTEIPESTPELLPIVPFANIDETVQNLPLQDMVPNSVFQDPSPSALERSEVTNLPFTTEVLSTQDFTLTEDMTHNYEGDLSLLVNYEEEVDLAAIQVNESDPGALYVDAWPALIELMETDDEIPGASSATTFDQYEVSSNSLFQSNEVIPTVDHAQMWVQDRHETMPCIIGDEINLDVMTNLNSLPSPNASHTDFLTLEDMVPELGSLPDVQCSLIEDTNNIVCQSFVNPDVPSNPMYSGWNMELIVPLMVQYYDRLGIKVVLEPKDNGPCVGPSSICDIQMD